MKSLGLLNRDDVVKYWPLIETWLRAEAKQWNRRWTLDSLKELSIQGKLECWVLFDEKPLMVVFTQILNFPRGDILQVFLAIGDGLSEGLPVIKDTLERFAIDNDCVECEITGRPGWDRILAPLGYKLHGIAVSKELLP